MTNAAGEVMDSVTKTGNNFSKNGDRTLSCESSVGGWEDGYFEIELSAPYDENTGDVEVRISSTLDQGATDESIGYGEMNFEYVFEDGNPIVEADYDEGVADPMEHWENNCGATQKTC
jgi:hypothetical protein